MNRKYITCNLFSAGDDLAFPLSRPHQVVMAVAQLYFHLAPKVEVGVIAKALVRLLRSHRWAAMSRI